MTFIVIEGIDGCGKTTLINKLKENLPKLSNREVVFVKNPMNSDYFSSAFSNYLKVRHQFGGCLELQRSLFLADLVYTNTQIIKPALDRGALVIADRWYPSYLVYQHFYPALLSYKLNPNSTAATYHEVLNRTIDWAEMEPLVSFLDSELSKPSLVAFLEIDPQEAKSRLNSRPNQATDDEDEADLSRLELLDKGYQFLKNEYSGHISFTLTKITPYTQDTFSSILGACLDG